MTFPVARLLALDAADRREEVLKINNANAIETSLLDEQALQRLLDQAWHCVGVGTRERVEAFLIALDQNAVYDNRNFAWFNARFSTFVYVDRVVTAAHARGRGHGRRLYTDLFAKAHGAGHVRVVCEVNRLPPNPGSDAFHRALGFQPVGEAILPNGRAVRYLEAGIDARPA